MYTGTATSNCPMSILPNFLKRLLLQYQSFINGFGSGCPVFNDSAQDLLRKCAISLLNNNQIMSATF